MGAFSAIRADPATVNPVIAIALSACRLTHRSQPRRLRSQSQIVRRLTRMSVRGKTPGSGNEAYGAWITRAARRNSERLSNAESTRVKNAPTRDTRCFETGNPINPTVCVLVVSLIRQIYAVRILNSSEIKSLKSHAN